MSEVTVPQLVIDAEVSGIAARLWFNGILLKEFAPGEPVRYAARVAAWAQPGANDLAIEWRGAAADARLKITVREAVGESDRTLFEYDRADGAPPAGQTKGQVRFEPLARWRWLDADRLAELTPADRQAIGALLESLHAMLANKDKAGLIAAQSMQIGEQAVAVGKAPEEALAEYRAFLDERMASPGWRVEPLTPASVRMELMGDGRVVAVTGAASPLAIVARSDDGMFAMAPYVARFGGTWAVVR